MTEVPPEFNNSIVRRAAENGIYISGGILLLTLLSALTIWAPIASIFVWLGSLAMPILIYKLLRLNFRKSNYTIGFAEMWAEGIASFFFGSLLPALVVYLLLKFAFPTFIIDQITFTIEQLRQLNTAESEIWLNTMEEIYKQGNLPGPVDVSANIISLNIIIGTVLSLFVTPFARMRR